MLAGKTGSVNKKPGFIYNSMPSFWEFLQIVEATRAGSKTGLYPFGYDGIGNYTPADWITSAADAIYYLDKDDRMFKTHEGSPFKISHIHSSSAVKPPKEHGMPGHEVKPKPLPNTEPQPKYKIPPGDVVRPTSWVKLVTHPKLLDPHQYKGPRE